MLTFALGASLWLLSQERWLPLSMASPPASASSGHSKPFIVIVLAGTGSILGAFPAGILLGVVEAVSRAFIGSTYREVVGLVIFVLVLILRPQGLFARK